MYSNVFPEECTLCKLRLVRLGSPLSPDNCGSRCISRRENLKAKQYGDLPKTFQWKQRNLFTAEGAPEHLKSERLERSGEHETRKNWCGIQRNLFTRSELNQNISGHDFRRTTGNPKTGQSPGNSKCLFHDRMNRNNVWPCRRTITPKVSWIDHTSMPVS
jgi:hypothetical protein